MGLYGRFVLPRLIEAAMKDPEAMKRREKAVPRACGVVLEVGVGSGLNLPLYTPAVTQLHAVDPSKELLAMARPRGAGLPFDVVWHEESAERVSLPDHAADTAVMTWVLCSIANPASALSEIRRVLKPDGTLIFVEHGLSPDRGVQAWQRWLTPLWRRLAGGSHLTRKVDDLLQSAGFTITEIDTSYSRGPRPMTFTYAGTAQPAR